MKNNHIKDYYSGVQNMPCSSKYLDFVEAKFLQCYSQKGYHIEDAVDITSQIDPTIDFIGSKISPLKKHILSGNIPTPGYALIQNCIKLKSLKTILSDQPSMFGGYYKGMGTLACPVIERSVEDLFEYLTSPNYLAINPEDICIRICSKDMDLMDSLSNINSKIKREVDTRDLCHYRHKYGMESENITGRDFNIGIRKNGSCEYINCATLVVVERDNQPLGIDVGIGNLSLAMCKFGKSSTIAASRMSDIIKIDSVEAEKLADALIVVATLLKENILTHPSNHFRKKYRQYLNAAIYWNKCFEFSASELTDIMIAYLKLEYKIDCSSNHQTWRESVQSHLNRKRTQ